MQFIRKIIYVMRYTILAYCPINTGLPLEFQALREEAIFMKQQGRTYIPVRVCVRFLKFVHTKS